MGRPIRNPDSDVKLTRAEIQKAYRERQPIAHCMICKTDVKVMSKHNKGKKHIEKIKQIDLNLCVN